MAQANTIPDEELEDTLETYLNPVRPRQEFVTRLKRRLTTEPTVLIENRPRATAYVVAALSLFFGALTVWLLIGLRGLLRGSALK